MVTNYYIFLDESGIHKQTGRSSIALIYLSIENLSDFQNKLTEIESVLGISNFHWSHSTWAIRKKFIEAICKEDFFIKIALIKNPFHATDAYEYALQYLAIEKQIIAIIIDGKKGKVYERKLKKALRNKGISLKKLQTANDGSHPALRVADAIAGIIRYRDEYPDNPKILQLYNLISKKIITTFEE